MDFMTHVLLPALSHLGVWGYWLVFLIAFAESVVLVGEVVPGSTLVIFAGFLAAQGVWDIGDLMWFAALGAILGDGVSYYLGTKGTSFFRNENRFLKAAHLERGERFFEKHGEKSIFLGRFLGFLRPLVPFVAGLSKMDPRRFLFWNVISAVLWAVSHLLIGYFFGSAFAVIESWTTRVGYGLGALLVFFLLLYALKTFVVRNGHQIAAFTRSVFLSIKAALAANPEVRDIIRRHPRLFAFVGKRLDRASFKGLPVTLIVIICVYLFFVFLGVTLAVVTSGPIVAADIRINNLLGYFRSPELTRIFLWITVLGTWQMVIFVAAVASIIFWLWREKRFVAYLWLALAADGLLGFLGKIAVHRARPENAVYLEHSYSFPSGHAMISVVLYGFLAYMLLRRSKGWKRKVNIFFSWFTLALAVGFSRLYLGVHYLSDVWAGYLLGLLILSASITAYEWRRHKKEEGVADERAAGTPVVKIATVALLAASALWYAAFAASYQPQSVAPQEPPTQYVSGAVETYFSDHSIPKYSETVLGTPQEPLNFIFLAKDDSVLAWDFEKASWFPADQVSAASLARAARAAITNGEYLHAPMTPAFWNAAVNDFSFERPTSSGTLEDRHHIRIWKTNLKQDGFTVYVGTASLDQGYKWFVTHNINPDIDSEREFVESSLASAGVTSSVRKVQFVDPTLGTNFANEPFFTDGKLYVISLQ